MDDKAVGFCLRGVRWTASNC